MEYSSLLPYLNTELARGVHPEDLERVLLEHGWQEAQVKNALAEVQQERSATATAALPDTTPSKKRRLRLWPLLLVVILVFLAGGGLLYARNANLLPASLGLIKPVTKPTPTLSTQATSSPVPSSAPSLPPSQNSGTLLATVTLTQSLAVSVTKTEFSVGAADDSGHIILITPNKGSSCLARQVTLPSSEAYSCGSKSYTFKLTQITTAGLSTPAVDVLLNQ